MTRQEAIEQIEKGKKLTHRFYQSHEWITKYDYQSNVFVFEDRNTISKERFLNMTEDDHWQKDWELFNDNAK